MGTIRIPAGSGYAGMISIAAYPGHAPVLKGSDIVEGWVRDEGDVWVREGWTFNSQQVFADGRLLDQIGGHMDSGYMYDAWRGPHKGKTRDEMHPGSFHYDRERERLYVRLADGSDPNERLIEADARTRLLFVASDLSYIRISGLALRHGSNFQYEYALHLNGRHCIVERVDQAWHSFGGGYVGGEFNTLSHSRFNHNGNSGLNGARRGHRLFYNETNFNNYRNWSTGWSAGGTKFIPGAHDWIVRGHVAAYNNGDGIWFDAYMSNITIEESFAYRNRGAGIHYEIGSRGVIKNNVVYENGMRGIYLSNASHTQVANNLVYRNGLSGIVVIEVDRNHPAIFTRGEANRIPGDHNVVSGNILVDNFYIPTLIREMQQWDMPASFHGFYHEALKGFAEWTARPELIMPVNPADGGTSYSDYNIFYRSGERGDPDELPFSIMWDMDFARGLADWTAKTGWDRNSMFARPRFEDEDHYNFEPADDCPSLWFVRKVEQSTFWYGMGGSRPGWMNPITAGPFTGRMSQFEAARDQREVENYSFFELGAVPSEVHHRLGVTARTMLESMERVYVTPLKEGVRIGDVPFLVEGGHALFLSARQTVPVVRESLPLRWTVDSLSLLLAGAPGDIQPFARITVHREDGVSIPLEVSATAEETIGVTLRGEDLPVEFVWSGTVLFYPGGPGRREPVRVYRLDWVNDNPWLPIREIEFELLDPEAELAILGLTGQRE